MKRLAFRIAALAATAFPPLASAAPAPPQPVQTLGFKGAELGMSLADWKALPFPGKTAATVTPVCSDEPQGQGLGLSPTGADQRQGLVLCTYATGATSTLDREPVPINDRYDAREVVYAFRDGRLVAIRYRTSIDAFDDVVARLKAQAGPPSDIARDTLRADGVALPRVRMDWRTPTAQVRLVDPVGPAVQISVEMTASG